MTAYYVTPDAPRLAAACLARRDLLAQANRVHVRMLLAHRYPALSRALEAEVARETGCIWQRGFELHRAQAEKGFRDVS